MFIRWIGKTEFTKRLIQNGADIDSEDEYDETPLEEAICGGQSKSKLFDIWILKTIICNT